MKGVMKLASLTVLLCSAAAVGLTRIHDAFSVSGYCTTRQGDVHWHAIHNTKEQCEGVCGSDCHWIAQDHHLYARHLTSMHPDESGLFILAVKEGLSISHLEVAEWETSLGTDLSHYAGHGEFHYFLAYMSVSTANVALSMTAFEDVTPYPNQWKLSPLLNELLRKGVRTESNVVHADILQVTITNGVTRTTADAGILASKWKAELLAGSGVTVLTTVETPTMVVVKGFDPVDLGSIVSFMAAQAETLWLEPDMIMRAFNDEATHIMQSGLGRSEAPTQAPVWNAGLHGEGQVVGCADAGLDYRHCFFVDDAHPVNVAQGQIFTDLAARKVIQYAAFADNGDGEDGGHGTHVMGSVAGKDLLPTAKGQFPVETLGGSAYEAKLAFFDIGLPNQANLVLPGSLSTTMFPPAYSVGARIHTNSWGSDQNAYSSDAVDIDSFSFTNQDFVVLVAAGNAGNAGTAAGSVGTPATAKNCIAVGASLNSNIAFNGQCPVAETNFKCYENMAGFSSIGPAFDQRNKPDIAAPGHVIWSSRSNPTTASCSYVNKSGTSMATPTTAGSLALVRQYFTDGYYPTGVKTDGRGFSPMGAALKATIINSAKIMTGRIEASVAMTPLSQSSAPNPNSGFGRVMLANVLPLPGVAVHTFALVGDSNNMKILSTGQSHPYSLVLNSASDTLPLKITLVWHDPPALAQATKTLINNLDLIVTDPNGQTLFPNGRQTADTINNVEQVTVTANVPGTYTITIKGTSVPKGPQPYALAVTGAFSMATATNLYSGLNPVVTPSAVAVVKGNPLMVVKGSAFGSTLATTTATLRCGSTGTPGTATVMAVEATTIVLQGAGVQCSGLVMATITVDGFVGVETQIAAQAPDAGQPAVKDPATGQPVNFANVAQTVPCSIVTTAAACAELGTSCTFNMASAKCIAAAPFPFAILFVVIGVVVLAVLAIAFFVSRNGGASRAAGGVKSPAAANYTSARSTFEKPATANPLARSPAGAIKATPIKASATPAPAIPIRTTTAVPVTNTRAAAPPRAPPSALAPKLPPGWTKCYDDASESHYYFNTRTGASSWDPPKF